MGLRWRRRRPRKTRATRPRRLQPKCSLSTNSPGCVISAEKAEGLQGTRLRRRTRGPCCGIAARAVQVERFRPQTLSDVLSHDDIVHTSERRRTRSLRQQTATISQRDSLRTLGGVCAVERFLRGGQLPHLLFHGPPGEKYIYAFCLSLPGTREAS